MKIVRPNVENCTVDASILLIFAINEITSSLIRESEEVPTKYTYTTIKPFDKFKTKSVICYKGDYDWLDIGRVEDYEAALNLFESDKNKYLP